MRSVVPLRILWLAALVVGAAATAGCHAPQTVYSAKGTQIVDLADVDPTFVIDARYATPDNFVGYRIYPSNKLFLERGAAERLAHVQQRLRRQGLGLKILDGYRPHRVQYRLWEVMPDPRYVARPDRGSRHNRGCAVDVTLVDLNGRELEMPTAFDDFSQRAHHDYMDLPPDVLRNRRILRQAMEAEGFTILMSEWWHYDAPGWEDFPLLDINPWGAELFPDGLPDRVAPPASTQ